MLRICIACQSSYEFEGSANLLAFCPHCKQFDYMECEYGFGPVVPCRIYVGSEWIGTVTYDDQRQLTYRLDCEQYHIHQRLEATYLDAIYEARDLIVKHLSL